MAGAEAEDARADSSGTLPLQGGRDDAVFIGWTRYHEGLVRHAALVTRSEKCAGPNGWLRGGEDPDLSC